MTSAIRNGYNGLLSEVRAPQGVSVLAIRIERCVVLTRPRISLHGTGPASEYDVAMIGAFRWRVCADGSGIGKPLRSQQAEVSMRGGMNS